MNERKRLGEDESGAAGAEFSLIPHETLLKLYRNLLKCRVVDELAGPGRRNADEGFPAAIVALAMDLRADDTIHFASEPSKTPRLRLQESLGAALLNKTAKNRRVVLVWGNYAAGQVWLDALESARAHTLPIVFVCEADLSAEGERAWQKRNAALEQGTELPRITVDGNDVVAMYRGAHEAIDRARRDRGPSLIECAEFRVPGRRHQDSVANMENYLSSKGLLRPGLKQEIIKDFRRELETQ
jgi:pyruvate dehydrogenase E1 component alpha subunit